MKKRILTSILVIFLSTFTCGSVEITSSVDETTRLGRNHPTIYSNRQTPMNSNSILSLEPTPASKTLSTSPINVQPESHQHQHQQQQQQQQQHPPQQHTTYTTKAHKPISGPSSVSGPSGLGKGSTLYNIQEQMQPPSANSQHYLFPTLPQSHPTQASVPAQQFIPAAGPFLMQILTPNGHPTGQVQYIQFLRPVMMPFMQIAPISTTQQPSIAQQYTPSTSSKFGVPPPVAQAYTQTSASIAQQYAPSAQISTTTVSDGGFYPYTQQPVASFSTPIASYYHPQVYSRNRIQLVSGPSELNLNTNEYVPASSELSYAAIKPIRA